MKIASGKKWITVIAAVLMVCVCALASAQSYSLGDEADEIATIQTALKKLKLYTGDITGHYGAKTQTAVKTFQKRYGLEDDGIAGEGTIQALYEAAEITYSGSSSSSSDSDSSGDSGSVLRQGSRSDAVRTLQEDLKALGYYTGEITGSIGSKTDAAIRSFQKKYGLTVDGIPGTQTISRLTSVYLQSGTSTASGVNLSVETVRSAQTMLKELGCYAVECTGHFGRKTLAALQAAARDNAPGRPTMLRLSWICIGSMRRAAISVMASAPEAPSP